MKGLRMRQRILSFCVGGIVVLCFVIVGIAQEKFDQKKHMPKESYLIGEEKNLEIIVHVWGEVRQPGEKRVPDGANILELISKAGGPTEYSDLSKVMLFTDPKLHSETQEKTYHQDIHDKFILEDLEKLRETGKAEINIKKYLENGKAAFLPRLLPGDVVEVKRNVWHKWQTFMRVASQIAIVAQVWYWYSRID